MTGWLDRLKKRANGLKGDTYALYLAYRHPGVPWYAKAWAALVVAYAFSPIDLVPDFIPVLGYLDDLVLIPLGVGLAIRMVPTPIMSECRQQAQSYLSQAHPKSWQGALFIGLLWLLGVLAAGWIVMRVVGAG
jgi:uncharacterized membrane protein YkvA (DUF1232 family)